MFMLKQISRNIEYRCDKDSAQAFGPRGIYTTLSFLGKSPYFTLFSTHPSTKKRIKRVEKVRGRKNLIRVGVISALSNAFAILTVLYMSLFFGLNADVPHIYEVYNNNINHIKYKIHEYKLDIMNFLEEY